MDLCSSLPSSPFLFSSFQCSLVILQALSLSLSAKITKLPSVLVTLQALSLFLAKVTKTLTQQTQITHATQLSILSHAAQSLSPIFHAYHYCQEPYRLYLPNLSHSNGSQVFQPCNDLWYLPKICSRISQICLCISVSSSLR